MSEDTKRNEDEDLISSAIGDFGKWQLFLTFALSLVNIPCTWHIFVTTFHSAKTDTLCARPANYNFMPWDLWKNCTGQNSDFCSMHDVRNSNFSESDLCRNYRNFNRIRCTNWEYDGRGEYLILFQIKYNLGTNKRIVYS